MDELAWTLAKRGHRVVAAGEPVDLRVLNTCAVTHVAARKSRKLIRQLRRQQPGAVLVATGCLVELEAPEAATTALGVDLIVGNLQKESSRRHSGRTRIVTRRRPGAGCRRDRGFSAASTTDACFREGAGRLR